MNQKIEFNFWSFYREEKTIRRKIKSSKKANVLNIRLNHLLVKERDLF